MVLALHQTDAAHSALRSLFDYAGLFPPAACSMAEACARYDRARRTPSEWMLGSFVVPLKRAEELIDERRRAADGEVWPISVLLGPADPGTVERLEAARRRWRGQLTLGALEIGPLSPAEIAEVASRLPSDVQVFFESPLDADLERRLDAIAAVGASAKVRMGGMTADAFPSVSEVARFFVRSKERELPFKATAGLHHPLRAEHAVTYDSHSPRTVMHGFLNVVVGALLLDADRVGEAGLEELLAEDRFEAFELGARSVGWLEQSVGLEQIERSRRSFFCSIGSCSFEEPVDELAALGLPAEGA